MNFKNPYGEDVQLPTKSTSFRKLEMTARNLIDFVVVLLQWFFVIVIGFIVLGLLAVGFIDVFF